MEKIQLRGAATARARNASFPVGEREERGKGNQSASPRKKEENWKTCARREKHEKRRLRDTETAAICAHSREKCGKWENK